MEKLSFLYEITSFKILSSWKKVRCPGLLFTFEAWQLAIKTDLWNEYFLPIFYLMVRRFLKKSTGNNKGQFVNNLLDEKCFALRDV